MKILQRVFSLQSINSASLQRPVIEGLRHSHPDDAEYDAKNQMCRVER